MKGDKHDNANDSSCYRLQDTDNRCLLTRLFKLGKLELATDREGDKAKGDVTDYSESVLQLAKAEVKSAGERKSAEAEAADQNSGYKITRYCGEL